MKRIVIFASGSGTNAENLINYFKDSAVELIMEFEKEFDIQIPDDQAENIGTVGQAISYIEEAKK